MWVLHEGGVVLMVHRTPPALVWPSSACCIHRAIRSRGSLPTRL